MRAALLLALLLVPLAGATPPAPAAVVTAPTLNGTLVAWTPSADLSVAGYAIYGLLLNGPNLPPTIQLLGNVPGDQHAFEATSGFDDYGVRAFGPSGGSDVRWSRVCVAVVPPPTLVTIGPC